jgi:prepilin-type N-terminal cleavage/methylation domain-containing protein/prepilin-type processing-associated H-X9-DG protein
MTDRCLAVSRRRGFTVGELLIALVIIAILSALLLPVFTQARAVARGGNCLANVQTITRAFRMYLADNHGLLPPSEQRQDVKDFFDTSPGAPGSGISPCPPEVATFANPYLRYPVLLDRYMRYRRAWQCPQARLQTGPRVIIPGPDWFGVILANAGKIGMDFCVRDSAFPPGWGGDVTDSFAQNRVVYVSAMDRAWGDLPGSVRFPFTQSIGVNGVRDLALASVPDPGSFILVGDAGPLSELMSPGSLAYPDICNVECANCWCSSWIEDCIGSIQQGCPEIAWCFQAFHANSDMLRNQTISARYTRNPYITYRDPSLLSSYPRHARGTNIGFLDGHAEWVDSGRFLDEWARQARRTEGWPAAMGIEAWGPYSWYDCGSGPFSQRSGGQPTLR